MEPEANDKVLQEVRSEEDAAEDEGVLYEGHGGSELDADPPDDNAPQDPGALGPPEGSEELAPAGLISIDNLLGVPLYYQGNGSTPQRTSFRLMPSFKPVLEATVRQVRKRAPAAFGELRMIVSLGMYTDKKGAHGAGVANDWDRLRFALLDISPRDHDHDSSSLPKRRRYWALAAICRSNSAFVLHGHYDKHHRNHIHQDTYAKLQFNAGSEANVKLFQAVLNEIFGQQPKLAVDGVWSDMSRAALAAAMRRLGLAGDVTTDTAVLQKFLRASGRLGFKLSTHS